MAEEAPHCRNCCREGGGHVHVPAVNSVYVSVISEAVLRRTDELEASGLDEDDATDQAHRELGEPWSSLAHLCEDCTGSLTIAGMITLGQAAVGHERDEEGSAR